MGKASKLSRIVRQAELCEKLELTRQGLYEMRRRGDIPQPIKFSRNSVGWPEDELVDWLASRPKAA